MKTKSGVNRPPCYHDKSWFVEILRSKKLLSHNGFIYKKENTTILLLKTLFQ